MDIKVKKYIANQEQITALSKENNKILSSHNGEMNNFIFSYGHKLYPSCEEQTDLDVFFHFFIPTEDYTSLKQINIHSNFVIHSEKNSTPEIFVEIFDINLTYRDNFLLSHIDHIKHSNETFIQSKLGRFTDIDKIVSKPNREISFLDFLSEIKHQYVLSFFDTEIKNKLDAVNFNSKCREELLNRFSSIFDQIHNTLSQKPVNQDILRPNYYLTALIPLVQHHDKILSYHKMNNSLVNKKTSNKNKI